MQGQAQQQAYDRGITIFSPDGRLYQVEYAREAVKRGTASVGVRTAEGVVLAADKRPRSSLMEPESIEKIHKVDDHVGIASAGHVADARQLIDFARRTAQINRLRYGEPIGIETLTKSVTDHIQQYTQIGGARPFGVALIIGGVANGEPRLFETDPSGTPYEWKALSIGSNRAEIRSFLEERFHEELTMEEGITLALEAIAESNDEKLDPEGVGVATVTVEDEAFHERTPDELETILEEHDLLLTEEDAEEDEEEDEEEAEDEANGDDGDDEDDAGDESDDENDASDESGDADDADDE